MKLDAGPYIIQRPFHDTNRASYAINAIVGKAASQELPLHISIQYPFFYKTLQKRQGRHGQGAGLKKKCVRRLPICYISIRI
jgi:hypothetical protein